MQKCFNSTLVRLNPPKNIETVRNAMCFNSTLVRLNHIAFQIDQSTTNGFQFHSGAIKSCYACVKCIVKYTFQFHSGAIKST